MNAFWKNLSRVAQDQLFARGYLSPGTAMAIATKRRAPDVEPKGGTQAQSSCEQPRLAAPH